MGYGVIQVNLLALEGVVRLGASMRSKLEPVVNTLVPAVCKNLASSNQQVPRKLMVIIRNDDDTCFPCVYCQPVSRGHWTLP